MIALRPARATDAPALVDLVAERLPDSRYFGLTEVDRDYGRKLFSHAAFRHGHTNEGGCWIEVAESDRGIEAFVFGSLVRVNVVGKMLQCQDALLLGRKGAPARALLRLLDGLIAWGDSAPRCIEVQLSWTDSLASGERFDRIYKRKGFTQCGAIYRRSTPQAEKGG